MSDDGTGRVGGRRGRALAVIAWALVAMLTLGGGRASIAAQGTPEAVPASGPCEPIEGESTAMAATPAGEGTPVAVGTPIADDEADAVLAAAENFVNCWNAGDVDDLVSLVTPDFLQQQMGTTDLDAMATMAGDGLPPITVESLENVEAYDDGRFSVEIQYRSGTYQVVNATHYFVESDGNLLVDEEDLAPSEVEGDSAVISFSVAADTPVGFDQQSQIPVLPVIIFFGNNNLEEAESFTAVRLPDGEEGTPTAAEGLPDDVEYVGSLRLQAGQKDQMVLVGLEPGVYALTTPDGAFATLTLLEPAA